MSMNTIKLSGATTVYRGSGAFLFYKKAGAGITNTDVDVYADNAYIATMSPTDSWRLQNRFEQLRFVPVDPLNQAVFVSAESAEQYTTAAVAGTVAVTGAVVTTDNILSVTQNTAYMAAVYNTIAPAASTFSFYFVNTSGRNVAVKDITCHAYDSVLLTPVDFISSISAATFTLASIPISPSKFIGASNLTNAGYVTAVPTGLVSLGGIQSVRSSETIKFDAPLVCPNNTGLFIQSSLPATTNNKNFICTSDINLV